MSDTADYGSGLGFGGAFQPATPDPGVGADVPPAPIMAQNAPPNMQADAPPEPGPSGFGSSLRSILPGPNYRAPDPQATALDQTADMLDQRIQRANQVATNPLLQVFNPEGVQAARTFVPAATEMLQKIKQQKAGMVANRQQAATLGLDPGEVADEASQADRVEAAKVKALRGDLRVFKGLQAVDPKTAEAIQDQVHEVVAGHLTKAQYAFDSLSGMQNQGQYAAKVSQLRKDGTLSDLEALGLKVPPTFEAFGAVKAKEGQALREARIGVDTIRQKLEERNTYQPMEEKEAKTYNGRMTTVFGDQITNGQWARNSAAGTRGLVVNGAADPRDLGKKFALATPEQRKAIGEEAGQAVPKAELEKARAFDRTLELAKPTEAQLKRGDVINTNPNVQQAMAEQLASMLRGGAGGANVGLLSIETSKRGVVQALLDKVIAGYAGGINTITGKDVRGYMSKLTQAQIREVMDGIKEHNDELLNDRVAPIAKRAGALGLDTTAFGWGKDEAAGVIGNAVEAGRQEQIARMTPNHQAIGGGDGVFQLGAQRPGTGAVQPPGGAAPATTQLPGAQPLQTPVQQAQQPVPSVGGPVSPNPGSPPPAGPAPAPAATQPPGPVSPPAGGGPPSAPVTIAGQQVSVPLPPGASPNYVAANQRIESGKEKDPWKADAFRPNAKRADGTPVPSSTASGAYQMIDSTWNENKPAGAPARAKDATPEQQSQAFATLTAKNGAALTAAGIPVNDTSLYVAHNLGAAGGTKLLTADPKADARTVVGETAARNNPLFFRGRPTVEKALERYQAEMSKEPPTLPAAGGEAPAEKPGLMERIQNLLIPKQPGETTEQALRRNSAATNATIKASGDLAVEHAPAIGSTVGGLGGAAVGNVPGAVAGGAVGGAAGQSFKDYMQGRPQNPTEIAKQAALGGALSVASEARPVLAAATRVLGPAAVEGGAKAAEGGDVADVTEATLKGGAYGLGGEALGRFVSALGPLAHKVLSKFTPDAQAELAATAGKLAAARETLATTEPKLAAGGANPTHEAAKKAEEDAVKYIKDHGQNPDDMVYAYNQVKGGTSAGEAATLRKANTEKADVGEGYNQLREDVRGAKPGEKNIKPNQALPDGPVSTIRTPENPTGKVPEAFRADAEHAEMLVRAPAKDWGDKWQQLQDAGSELIKKRMAFLSAGDKPGAEAMNNIFEGVRNQQKAVADRLFGKERGAEVIAHLENLDKRYAKVMNATAGMDYKRMREIIQGGNTPERRELEANFRAFAKDDPSALRAFNAMKAGAQGRITEEAKLMLPVIAGEFAANASGVPTVGVISAAIGGHRMVSMLKEYMNAKLLGKAVTFKDFLMPELRRANAMNAAGAAVQHAVVQ